MSGVQRRAPADLFDEMVRVLDGEQPTLPRAFDGRVVRSWAQSKSGVEAALVDVLALVRDEVQQ